MENELINEESQVEETSEEVEEELEEELIEEEPKKTISGVQLKAPPIWKLGNKK